MSVITQGISKQKKLAEEIEEMKRKFESEFFKDMSEPLPVIKDTGKRPEDLGVIVVTGKRPKGQPSDKSSKKKVYGKESKKSYKRVTDPFMGRGTGPGSKKVLVEDRPIKKRPKRKMVNPARGFSHGGRPTGQGFGVARFNRGGPAKNRVPY